MSAQPRIRGGERAHFAEAILDNLTSGVMTAGVETRVTFANRKALQLLGLEAERALGSFAGELFGASAAPRQALLTTGAGADQQVEFEFRRGGAGPLSLGMTVIHAASAPPQMRYLILFRDVSERLRTRSEMGRLERLSALGGMVAGFAHEVRNPLAGIQALTETLLGELAPEDPHREYASRILVLLARVEGFVRASLEFGQPRPPDRRPHSAASLVARAVEAVEGTAAAGTAGLRIAVEGPVPDVLVDGGQITDSLLALLENALESTGTADRVAVRISAPADPVLDDVGHAVQIDVVDNGPGIPEGLIGRIFDPFFTTKPKEIGLGLSIAQTLIRENGGRLFARSTPGVETVFSVLLPEVRS